MKSALQRLERAWRRWLNYATLGAALAFAVAGHAWKPLAMAASVLLVVCGVINIGYGVALLRLLVKRRRGAM